jgi:uncharacterized Fe-S cluster protein YjdI
MSDQRAREAMKWMKRTNRLRIAECVSGREIPRNHARINNSPATPEPEIRVSLDGPYIVANLPEFRNWLGEELPLKPHMELCRCGQSSTKPFCDGSHAESNFSGEKDPNRVPDRRDVYDGQQIEIFDNRGICAHSGFCTDSLASVFHVGQDPFISPSGGRMDEIIQAVRACPSGALSYGIDHVEARGQVDRNRPSWIEVSKTGPAELPAAFVC